MRHKRTFWVLLVVVAVVFLCSPVGAEDQSAQESNRRALVIGNGDYPLMPLKNPVNDARDIKTVLEQLGFEVQLAENAGLENMARAVDSFVTSVRPGDSCLFFYSGHGVQIDGINYLLPVDFIATDEISAKYRSVSAEEVRERMERSGAGLNIIVLDACRSNPFKITKALDGGLAAMNTGRGTFIAFATGPNQTASDNPVERNGLYTKHLLDALQVPGLKLDEVFNKVREGVFRASAGRQLPWTGSSVIGDFYFLPPAVTGQTPGEARPQGEVTAEAAYGTLRVTVNVAGAEVLVDGGLVARSSGPQTLSINVPIGYRTITVRKEGHSSDVVAKQLAVRRTQVTELDAWLEPTNADSSVTGGEAPNLTGTWITVVGANELEMVFKADGGMTFVDNNWNYSVAPGKLTVHTATGSIDYNLQFYEDRFVLSGGDIDGSMEFSRAAGAAPDLVGTWVMVYEGQEFEMVFNADGSMTFVDNYWNYSVEPGKLTVHTATGSVEYNLLYSDDKIVLSGGDITGTFEFIRKASGPAINLAGTWVIVINGQETEMVFRADGTMTFVGNNWNYTVAPGKITVHTPTGSVDYNLRYDGNRIVISGGDLTEPMELTRKASPGIIN
jgi:hypothetical protein